MRDSAAKFGINVTRVCKQYGIVGMFIRITNVTLSESVDTCLRNGWSTSHRALDDFNGNFKHGPPSNNNKC